MAKVISFFPLLFTGRLGNVIGYIKDGKQMIRELPKRRKGGYTRPQMMQQKKFSLVIGFLKPLIPLLRQTLGFSRSGGSNYNKAFSYHINNAITGEYPFFKMDYAKVMPGIGSLTPARTPAVFPQQGGRLLFAWSDNSNSTDARADDEAWVAIYCPEPDRWIYYLACALRKSGHFSSDVTPFSGKTAHCYLGFISRNGKTVSNSSYLGLVSVM
jgi:hypothetical protein